MSYKEEEEEGDKDEDENLDDLEIQEEDSVEQLDEGEEVNPEEVI